MSGLETVTKNSGEVLVGALFALEMILNSDTASSKVTSVFKWIHTNSETQAKKIVQFYMSTFRQRRDKKCFSCTYFYIDNCICSSKKACSCRAVISTPSIAHA